MANETAPLLEVRDLSVAFRMYTQGVRQETLQVISNMSVEVHAGEVLAVVGASGSGKSLLAHAVLGLLPGNAEVVGELRFKGDLLDERNLPGLRGNQIALVPQSVTSLDPLMRVGAQVTGSNRGADRVTLQQRVFERLGLAPQTERMFPHQLSGGMARRVLFSTAVIEDADLIIADEPTPGMQVEQAVEALGILRELADAGKGVILITHDIDLAIRFADRIAVFYSGTVLEIASTADFASGPDALRHPYTKALWNALPQHGFTPIPGTQPYAGKLPSGCLFAPRCPIRTAECEASNPPMRELRDGLVRCIHAT